MSDDEHALFEKVFPMPLHTIRCGNSYAATEYSAWAAQDYAKKWEGWKARSELTVGDAEVFAKAVERRRCREFEWNDEQFEIWWNKDARCEREKLIEEAAFGLRAVASEFSARSANDRSLCDFPFEDSVQALEEHGRASE